MKGKSDTVPSQENRQGIDDRHQKIVSVLAAHKVALWEYDIRTGVCSFDEDYFRILGLTEAGVEFSDIDDFYRFAHPDDVSNYREAFGRMLASDTKNACIRVRCVGNKGQVIWLEDNFFSYQSDEEGRPQKLVAYTGNITARCEGEARIRALEERNRKVIEALPEFIFIMDDRFFITDVLMASGTVLLHPVEELIGADGRTIYSAEVSDLFVRNIRECLADGKIREIEYPLDVESGRHYFQARIAPYEKNKVLALIHDIGDRVRWSKELIEAKARAEESDRMKSVFLATMSHEIRTPLNAIIGLVTLAIASIEDSAKVQDCLTKINFSSKHLLMLIDDILDMSQIESNKMKLQNEEFDIYQFINSFVVTIYSQAKAKNLEFVVDVEETLPKYLEGDALHIKQVILNLINNAVKYTKKGKVFLEVCQEEKQISFSVKDTGIGIKKEDMEALFDMFMRADIKRHRNIEGSGLGLTIAKELCEQMGGHIQAESIYGKGSNFTVYFPLKDAGTEKIGQWKVVEGEPVQEKRKEFFASEAQILLVDDSEQNIQVITSLLRRTGVQLDTAASGFECIEKVRNKKYHLIFLDYMMPEMDGIETFHRLKKEVNGQSVPVIALTADVSTGIHQHFLSEGFSDYLSKPVMWEKLEELLLQWLPAALVSMKNGAGEDWNITEKQLLDLKQKLKKWDIELSEGLHLLGGSIVQYRKLSELFVEYYEPNRKKLEESFETTRKTQQEIKILTGQIHTLKSNARAIGAMSLYELAASLEIRGKMQDESYIEKAIPLLFFEWERALDGMFFFLENTKKFVLESEKKEKENGKQKVYGELTEEVNQEKLYEETYDGILEAIGKYQGKYAEEQLEKLLSLEKNPKKKKILGQVQKSVQNLEFEQAESLMKGTYWTNKVTTEWEDRNGQK